MGDRIDIRIKKLIVESTPNQGRHDHGQRDTGGGVYLDSCTAPGIDVIGDSTGSIESIEAQIRCLTVNSRIDSLVVRSLHNRLSTLEAAFAKLTTDQKWSNAMTQQEIQELTDQITAQTHVQASLETALSALTTTVTSAVQKIDDLAGQIAANANDPAVVADLISQLKAHNAGLGADMNTIASASTSLGAAVAANTPVAPTSPIPAPATDPTPAPDTPPADAAIPNA